jgi:hypothetical protein
LSIKGKILENDLRYKSANERVSILQGRSKMKNELESMTSIQYVKPAITDLRAIAAIQGGDPECNPGSAATINCATGVVAGTTCQTGDHAETCPGTGSTPVT